MCDLDAPRRLTDGASQQRWLVEPLPSSNRRVVGFSRLEMAWRRALGASLMWPASWSVLERGDMHRLTPTTRHWVVERVGEPLHSLYVRRRRQCRVFLKFLLKRACSLVKVRFFFMVTDINVLEICVHGLGSSMVVVLCLVVIHLVDFQSSKRYHLFSCDTGYFQCKLQVIVNEHFFSCEGYFQCRLSCKYAGSNCWWRDLALLHWTVLVELMDAICSHGIFEWGIETLHWETSQ